MSEVSKKGKKGKKRESTNKAAKGKSTKAAKAKSPKKDAKSPKKGGKTKANGKGKGNKGKAKASKANKEESKEQERKPVVVDFGPPVILPDRKNFVTKVPAMTTIPLEEDENVEELTKQFDDLMKRLKDRKKTCLLQARILVSKDNEETDPICVDIEGMKHIINNIGSKRGEADYAVMGARQQILDTGRSLLALEAKHAAVTKEREKTSKKAVQGEIDDCKNQLSEAEPVLQAAKDAVKSITKSSLDEIRALPKPHKLLVKAVKACAIMVGTDESQLNGWPQIKKLLKTSFIDSLLHFEARNITAETRKVLESRDFLAKDCDDIPDNERLTFENVNKANAVAGSLVKWIEAQLKYNEFIPKVEPIQAKLEELKIQLGNVEGVQKKLDDALAECEKRIDVAKNELRDNGKDFTRKVSAAQSCKN